MSLYALKVEKTPDPCNKSIFFIDIKKAVYRKAVQAVYEAIICLGGQCQRIAIARAVIRQAEM
jgi:ABC-type dipeptide/oligopeptide/nickel transport system ATPase subunit